eukprot:CAMPEP_0179018838 /NCGR_PEP_ID=MMETSP0796-20121207/4561_1 /TAXON_ID=73915 /ORGANISM="Pyrodinium bahamense, Strain pbaha01" /LENGTH=31 /DNA_ID= /DNA_START= /DNA_END= /DNA_ORIENTATION=
MTPSRRTTANPQPAAQRRRPTKALSGQDPST